MTYLRTEGLQNCCTIDHIVHNFDGGPRHGRGRKRLMTEWLRQVANIEMFEHDEYGDCIRLRSDSSEVA